MTALETSVSGWMHIVRGEYQEIPGLHLTKLQARRLWGLDEPTCDALLSALVAEHFLKETATGQYARR